MIYFSIEDSRFASDADRQRAVEVAEKKVAELGMSDDEVIQAWSEHSEVWKRIESAALIACFARWEHADEEGVFLSVTRY